MLKIGQAEVDAATRVIKSGALFRYGEPPNGQQSECEKFEQELAAKMGVEHALVVTSGTAALMCALVGLGVGPGDEVIVPAYTFVSSALAPLAVGAIPVIAEVDESLTLDPVDVQSKITGKTKVIMPVHMVGLPANMSALTHLARRHGVAILEDACQADGGFYSGRRLGSIGDVGVYSFNYFKNITCGEGGALVTNNDQIFERAFIYHDGGAVVRSHGQSFATPFFAGCNFRMNEILAAILRVQLRRVDHLLVRNRSHKRRLMSALAKEPSLRFMRHNDLNGECATVLGLQFDDEPAARRFESVLQLYEIDAWLPIDSGRHVYTNWEPIMQKRGAFHPALDAFRLRENRSTQMRYSAKMCPHTLDLLARTVYLNISPEWKTIDVQKQIDVCRQAAAEIAAG